MKVINYCENPGFRISGFEKRLQLFHKWNKEFDFLPILNEVHTRAVFFWGKLLFTDRLDSSCTRPCRSLVMCSVLSTEWLLCYREVTCWLIRNQAERELMCFIVTIRAMFFYLKGTIKILCLERPRQQGTRL